jgi:hypothetical protein
LAEIGVFAIGRVFAVTSARMRARTGMRGSAHEMTMAPPMSASTASSARAAVLDAAERDEVERQSVGHLGNSPAAPGRRRTPVAFRELAP